ncbi:MAG: methylated-DNA--[protein]-cysteine S-methyltransferase, partial [Thermodesulfovibrionaceae bacterium]
KWIAKKLQTSPRAVGQALKRNPLPIIIPCHRVIKSNGELGGYSLGVETKKWLVEHEKTILYKLRLHKI